LESGRRAGPWAGKGGESETLRRTLEENSRVEGKLLHRDRIKEDQARACKNVAEPERMRSQMPKNSMPIRGLKFGPHGGDARISAASPRGVEISRPSGRKSQTRREGQSIITAPPLGEAPGKGEDVKTG